MPRIVLPSVVLVAVLSLAGCYAPVAPIQEPQPTYTVQTVQVEPQVRTVSVPTTYRSQEPYVTARVDVMIRKGPGKSYQGCGHLPKGASAELLDCKGNWCKIRYEGQEGWSHQNYLNFYSHQVQEQVITQQVVEPGYSVNYVLPTQSYPAYPQTYVTPPSQGYYKPISLPKLPSYTPARVGGAWWEPR